MKEDVKCKLLICFGDDAEAPEGAEKIIVSHKDKDFSVEKLTEQIRFIFFPHIPTGNDMLFYYNADVMNEHPQFYFPVIHQIEEFIHQLAVQMCTHTLVGAKWLVNILHNLKYIRKSIPVTAFFETHKNKPAVIVSAGPSLNKNIKALYGMEDKILIIAVGTALKPLLINGIKPHIVVGLDASEKHLRHFEGIKPEDVKDIFLVYDPMIYPEILRTWKGKLVCCECSSLLVFRWLEKTTGDLGFLASGYSVASTAISLALRMDARPVILVGQDLSIPNTGETHCNGTMYDNLPYNMQDASLLEVDAYGGGKIKTTPAFMATARFLEMFFKQSKANIWNCTEGGARIQGTEERPLALTLASIMAISNNGLARSKWDGIKQSHKLKTPPVKPVIKELHGMLDLTLKRKPIETFERYPQGMLFCSFFMNEILDLMSPFKGRSIMQKKLRLIREDYFYNTMKNVILFLIQELSPYAKAA